MSLAKFGYMFMGSYMTKIKFTHQLLTQALIQNCNKRYSTVLGKTQADGCDLQCIF
jgi:hypothetical protein